METFLMNVSLALQHAQMERSGTSKLFTAAMREEEVNNLEADIRKTEASSALYQSTSFSAYMPSKAIMNKSSRSRQHVD
jgi:hypothetical protein